MDSKKQIIVPEDLIGKTIEKVFMPRNGYRPMFIKFTDGTFTAIEYNDEIITDRKPLYSVGLINELFDDSEQVLSLLGIITREEHLAEINKQAEKAREYLAEREKEEKAYKWKEYLKLKEYFGNDPEFIIPED